MSKNFFAALDDDDDEPVAQAPPKVQSVPTKAASKPAVTENVKEHRNTKHGRGERAPARAGKRAYDRRSGTGRGHEIKKEGAGARNWGSDKTEAKKAEGPIDESDVQTLEQTEDATTKEEQEPEPIEEEVLVEEVDNTISYDEYLKTKARPANELFAPKTTRQVENAFACVKPKTTTEEDFLVMGENKQRERVREGKKKVTIVPSFKVASSDAAPDEGGRGGRGRVDRGGRGGRGRGRDGGRGRDAGRGRDGRGSDRGRGRGRSTARTSIVNPLDPASFPSLA